MKNLEDMLKRWRTLQCVNEVMKGEQMSNEEFRQYADTLADIAMRSRCDEVRENTIDECLNAICNNCRCADECLGYCQHYKALEELKEKKQ